MSKGIFRALVAGLLALTVVMTGCGGGDDTTSDLTKAQFLKQANAICKKATDQRNAEIRKAIEGLDQSKLLSLKKREALVLDTLPTYANLPKELEELGAPEGEEEKVEEITKAMEKAAADVEKDPAKALTSTSQFAEANKLTAEYGLSDCVL